MGLHKINEHSLYGLFKDLKLRQKNNITGAGMIPTNANQCKVACDGNSVYANTKFRNGDIIEICPARNIDKSSLYTREVRDIAFEVLPEVYVIPMGYCQYYNIIDKQHPEANCDYEWDDKRKCVVIRALCTIPKSSILILNIAK